MLYLLKIEDAPLLLKIGGAVYWIGREKSLISS